jgi:hypothetical protein
VHGRERAASLAARRAPEHEGRTRLLASLAGRLSPTAGRARGAPSFAARFALAAVLFTALWTGWLGIDFGHHWDESERIATAILAIERGDVVPAWYQYPSAIHDLIVLCAAPELVRHALAGPTSAPGAVRAALESHDFLLRVRAAVLALSAIGALASYACARRWRGNAFEGVTAAALFALSWEVAYHARWIAPDVITASLGAVVLWAALGAMNPAPGYASASSKPLPWLAAAGCAAGFACSAKYPSGLLLLPVAVAVARVVRGRRSGALAAVATSLGAFVAAYLVVTPGTLLDARQFWSDVHIEIAHYAAGHGGGHSIPSGWPHLTAEIEYLGLVVFSRDPRISLFYSALALVGAAWALRRDRWMAAALLSFVVAYVGYFSLQRVMIARNLLVVVPFLAVLAARGVGVCAAALGRHRSGRALLIAGVGGPMLIDAAWLFEAAQSIRDPRPPERDLLTYLSRPSARECVVSPRLRAALAGAVPNASALPAALRSSRAEAAEWAAFYASDVGSANGWTGNRRDATLRTFGPLDVNFNYYPSWRGHDRIVLMRVEDTRGLRLPLLGPARVGPEASP